MRLTGAIEDEAKFKVPSLRNIELTGPYMHDGRFKTLEEVINHYNEHETKSNHRIYFAIQFKNPKV